MKSRQLEGVERRTFNAIEARSADRSGADSGNDKVDPEQSGMALRQRLLTEAERAMPRSMKQEFSDNIDNFEKRAKDWNISAGQKSEFYGQVARLLDVAQPRFQDGRVGWHAVLAGQIMSYAADPRGIDQGAHKTCGAAALEAQMFTRDPSDAARLIADVFLTGQFVPRDSRKPVVPDSSLFQPDNESNCVTPKDGQRSYASQLFQGTAISMVYPGYRQVWRRSNNKLGGPYHLEEVVVEVERTKKGNRTVETEFDGLYPSQLVDMNRKIAGDRNPLSVVERRNINLFDGMNHVGSEQELSNELKKLKEENKLPVIAFVNSDHEPFWTDGLYGQRNRLGGGHFVCVTDFKDLAPAMVAIDNQWGKRGDHSKVSAQQLYLSLHSSRPYWSFLELEHTVEKNRTTGNIDLGLELECLRRKRSRGSLTADQFSTAVEDTVAQFEKRQQSGLASPEEQSVFIDQWHQTGNFDVLTRLDELKKRYSPVLNRNKSAIPSFKSSLTDFVHAQLTADAPLEINLKGSR